MATNNSGPVNLNTEAEYGGLEAVGDYGPDDFKSLLIISVNGEYSLPEQTVRVEYLKTEHKLVIPYALSMSPSPVSNAETEMPIQPLLRDRYLKVLQMLYSEVKECITQNMTNTEIAQSIDARNHNVTENPLPLLAAKYDTDAYYVLANGTVEDLGTASVVYRKVSQALGFNCDIRDVGRLLYMDMRLVDDEWKRAKNYDIGRLVVKLKSFTLVSIAALNYEAVGRSQLAAWVRAYGVCSGVLASARSLYQKEYRFESRHAPPETRRLMLSYMQTAIVYIYPLCMNIIAMFGLLHLNQNRTYRTNDANMTRICDSYLMTLKTLMPDYNMSDIEADKEAICMTAAHPFGLGQTYFVAILMHNYGALTPPLRFHIDLSPPPIQRFMIVRHAVAVWSNLPVGNVLNELYAEELTLIRNECAKIFNEPASYSKLHRYYGIETMSKPGDREWNAIETLMPIVYGFEYTFYHPSENRKDIPALALSLKNVERDKKALSHAYKNLWEKYIFTMDKVDLAKFATDVIAIGNLQSRTFNI